MSGSRHSTISIHNANISHNSLSYPTPNWQDSACQCSLHSSNISMLHPPTLLIFPQLKFSSFINPILFNQLFTLGDAFSYNFPFHLPLVADMSLTPRNIHTVHVCTYITPTAETSARVPSITQTPCAILQPPYS